MDKPGNTSIDLLAEKNNKYLWNKEWTLCLGAGICSGILPDWQMLTKKVANKVFEINLNDKDFKEKLSQSKFELNSWLQSCLNKMLAQGKTVDDFNSIIEDCLYDDLIKQAEEFEKGLGYAVKILIRDPHKLVKKELLGLCSFFDSKYAGHTLLQLKNILTSTNKEILKPSAIITFNADPLLHSLVLIYNVRRRYQESEETEYNFLYEDYVRVVRPFELGYKKTPIYHLHGSLYPKINAGRGIKTDARENLIFSEASYSRVAGAMHTWAQNTFLHYAATSRMVFVGMSMSDPNVRKWLSWTAEDRNSQLEMFTKRKTLSLQHIWVKQKPDDEFMEEFLIYSLQHLSTKPGWIASREDLERGLLNIMGEKCIVQEL